MSSEESAGGGENSFEFLILSFELWCSVFYVGDFGGKKKIKNQKLKIKIAELLRGDFIWRLAGSVQ